jgi:hypothetical protein
MKATFILLVSALLASPLWADFSREQDLRFGVYSRGIKVGLGLARADSSSGKQDGSGLAFSTGLFTSFGWRGIVLLVP